MTTPTILILTIWCALTTATTTTLLVFTNGGNNTADETASAQVAVDLAHDAFANVLLRIARTLNALPADCTPFSVRRPKRPLSHLVRTPSESTASLAMDQCATAVIETWLQRVRLHDSFGRHVNSMAALQSAPLDAPFVLVGAGDHFVWPGWQVGHRVSLPDVVVDGAPLVLETLALEPRLFYIDRFLAPAEAALIIEHARARLEPSYVFDQNAPAKIHARNSDQTWLQCDEASDAALDRLVCALDRRVAAVTRVPLDHVRVANDHLQVVHYDEQAHYHAHHDYFDPTLSYLSFQLRTGQQRLFTLLFYLNEPEAGGFTVFPRTDANNGYGAAGVVDMADCSRGIRVTPKRGAAILWYNLKATGNGHEAFLDARSLHGGCDVERGEKFAANKWIYNRKQDAVDFSYYIDTSLTLL